MKTIALLFIAIYSCSGYAFAQSDSIRRMHQIEAVVAGGPQLTRYSLPPTLQSDGTDFLGSSFTGRVLWRGGHLIAIGALSGYVTFSGESFLVESDSGVQRTVDVRLAAIPVQLALSMNPGNFEIGTGIGAYFLESILGTENGYTVAGAGFEFGISAWLAYTFPLSSRCRVGPEIMVHVLSNRGAAGFAGTIQLSYDIYRY